MAVEHLTPQQVLEILQEYHRQACANGDAFSCLSFGMDSTVEDWRDAMMVDYFKWRNAGITLNWLFNTDISDEIWHDLLIPTKSKKLGPICEQIASKAVAPVIEPLSILGMRCEAAGAFLMLRDQLESRDLDVSDLRPSTPLEPFLINHLEQCYPELIKLGVGRIPEIKIQKRLYDFCLWGFVMCLLVGFISSLCGALGYDDHPAASIVLVGSILMGALLYIGLYVASRMKPHRIHFGNLHDFRDLCRVLVSPPSATLPTTKSPR